MILCILGQDLSVHRATDLRALIPWWIVGLSLQQTKNWASFFLFLWVVRIGQLKATSRGRDSRCSYSSQCATATHTICRRSFFFFSSLSRTLRCSIVYTHQCWGKKAKRIHLSWLNACGSFFQARISTINLRMSSHCFLTRLYCYIKGQNNILMSI